MSVGDFVMYIVVSRLVGGTPETSSTVVESVTVLVGSVFSSSGVLSVRFSCGKFVTSLVLISKLGGVAPDVTSILSGALVWNIVVSSIVGETPDISSSVVE